MSGVFQTIDPSTPSPPGECVITLTLVSSLWCIAYNYTPTTMRTNFKIYFLLIITGKVSAQNLHSFLVCERLSHTCTAIHSDELFSSIYTCLQRGFTVYLEVQQADDVEN
jgi:hypothetical protein